MGTLYFIPVSYYGNSVFHTSELAKGTTVFHTSELLWELCISYQ